MDVKKSILWNSIGSTVYLACLWLLNILVVRIGNYAEAGILSLSISIANVIQSISLAGIRNYQVSDVSSRYSNNTYIITRYITSFLGFIICIIFVVLNPYNLYEVFCIILMSIYRIIDALSDVYHGILQKKWKLDIVGKALVIRGLGIVFAFSLMLHFFQNLLYAILAMIIVSSIILLFYEKKWATIIDKIDHLIDKKSIFSLIKHAIPLVAYSTLLNSISVITRYYIEYYCGEEVLGYYSSIASPALIVQVAATYIFNPLIGTFANLYKDRKFARFVQLMLKCLGIICGLIILAIICCALLGQWGLKLLFGKDILSYSYLLVPIVLNTALTALVLFVSMLLVVVRNLKGLVLGNGIGFVVNLILCPIFLVKFGLQGANYILIFSLIIDIVLLILTLLFSIRRESYKKLESD